MYVLWILAGASLFSFINVLVYRMPRGMDFVKSRSICPSCGQNLKWGDLIPVLSWLMLGGRCRYCHKRISPRYPLIELWGGICGFLCMKSFGAMWQTLLGLSFLALLTAVSLIDWDTMEIPDELNATVFLIGVLAAAGDIFGLTGSILAERLIGMICVSFPMFLLILLIPDSFGGGDVKLMCGIGFFLGWKKCILSFALAVMAGGIYGGCLLAAGKKKRKDHFAFGPFLCGGAAAACLFGDRILEWYLNLS